MLRIYLTQSFPGGWGGVEKTAESMRLYGALAGATKAMNGMSVPQLAEAQTDMERGMTHMYLAERDPQHHGWPSRGVTTVNSHASTTPSTPEPLRLRILLSYWYYKDTDLDALFAKYFTPPYPEVFADSGAFSAMTQGVPIDVHAYARWVLQWRHLFQTYANLDVIKDAAGTWRNQHILEREYGLNPLPVFHVLEDWRYLERYINLYRYIALGVAGTRTSVYMPWLVQAFKRARTDPKTRQRLSTPRAVYHGFGITSWEPLKAFPWYSVDSSSWGQGFRYGQVPIFDPRAGTFRKVSLGNHTECFKYAPLIRNLGFDPADFADRTRNDRAKVCAISALSYLYAERWLRKRHGEIHIPGSEDTDVSVVLRTHLADANPRRFGEATKGMSAGPLTYLSDTSNGINYGDADRGVKAYLADARGHSASEIASAETGLKMHLAEHSLDRGGVGDTSRALDVLKKKA